MEVIHKILELALWTPSGDNQQTWRFRVEGSNRFSVFAWDTREHCVYDLQGHATQIALGALFETIRIAATQYGLVPQVYRRDSSALNQYRFDVELRAEPDKVPDPLVDVIPTRSVQRRAMSFRPLHKSEKRRIEMVMEPRHQVIWLESLPTRTRVASLLYKNAKLRLTLPEAYKTHASVIEWRSRFSHTRVPDQAVGLDPVSTRLMEWVLGSWQRVQFANRFLGGTFFPRIQLDLIPAIACAAHFVITASTPPRSAQDFMDAGAVWMRAWLTFSALGLSIQPEMTPLIFADYARQGLIFSEEVRALERAGELRRALIHLLTEETTGRAVVMGRVGAGPAATARSLRRPLPEMLLQANAYPSDWKEL